jgi:hypothetical protein
MRKLILGIVLITSLLALAPPAQAMPTYGQRFTATHGYIVWAKNDRYFTIRTRCHWTAGGYRWTTNWVLYPGAFKWTTSDAGNWGDRRPRNLGCNYVRI